MNEWKLIIHPARKRKGYNPDQPRIPAGQSGGGRWTSGGSGGSGTDSGEMVSGTVYRGASSEEGFERSSGWDFGVYVSTDPVAAGQWGKVRAYTLKKTKKVVDLGNWNSVAKVMVAKELGLDARDLDFSEYDQAAGELFIQMPKNFAMRAQKYGFDGVRLGKDIFLIGKLSDHAAREKMS